MRDAKVAEGKLINLAVKIKAFALRAVCPHLCVSQWPGFVVSLSGYKPGINSRDKDA